MSTVKASMRSANGDLTVRRMLVFNQINRLPCLFAVVESAGDDTPPELKTEYTLELIDNAATSFPLRLSRWYVNEYRVVLFNATSGRQRYLVYCGVVPGQNNRMGAFALQSDDPGSALSLKEVLSALPVPAQMEIDSSGVSSGDTDHQFELFCGWYKTLEQVLRQAACSSDTWFSVSSGSDNNCLVTWKVPNFVAAEGSDQSKGDTASGVALIGERIVDAPERVNSHWVSSREQAGNAGIDFSETVLPFISPVPTRGGQDTARLEQKRLTDYIPSSENTFRISYLAQQRLAALAWGAGDSVQGRDDTYTLLSLAHVFEFESGIEPALDKVREQWGCGEGASILGAAVSGGAAHVTFAIAVPQGHLPEAGRLGEELLEIEQPFKLWTAIGRALGLPLSRREFEQQPAPVMPDMVLAHVALADGQDSSNTQASIAHPELANQYASVVNVKFDWLQHPIRVPLVSEFAGAGGDIFFQPTPGDLVLVGFMNGESAPVVLGAVHYRDHAVTANIAEANASIGKAYGKQTQPRGISLVKGLVIETTGDGSDIIIRAKNRIILTAPHVVTLTGTQMHGPGVGA